MLWDTATARCVRTLKGHTGWVHSVAWSPGARRLLASGSEDRTVRIWDAATGKCMSTLAGHTGDVFSVAWSHSASRRLASSSGDHTIKIWDAATGECLSTLEGHTGPVHSLSWALGVHPLSWSPSGATQFLASGSEDGTVRVWNTASGHSVLTLRGEEEPVCSVAWSPDGSWIASGKLWGQIETWDLQTGRCSSSYAHHDRRVNSMAWLHDGSLLVSGSNDGTVEIGSPLKTDPLTKLATPSGYHTKIQGPFGAITAVTWSPDGTALAMGAHSRTIQVWDSTTHESLASLNGHDGFVLSLAW